MARAGERITWTLKRLGVAALVLCLLVLACLWVAQEPTYVPTNQGGKQSREASANKAGGRSFEQARFHHNVTVAAKRLRAAERLQSKEVPAQSRGSP